MTDAARPARLAVATTRDAARRAAEAIRAHPRHAVLFALVAGLLLGPASMVAVLGASAVALGLAGRPPVALACAIAVLAGAWLADARTAALDRGGLAGRTSGPVAGEAVVLEPVRERARGPAVARVRLLAGSAAGATLVARVRPASQPGRWPGVGEVVKVKGRLAPLGRYDAYQRRRGAVAALDATGFAAAGRRRGGPAGALDAVRRRAERALEVGLRPPEAALLRGMVLGQDERLEEEVREDFERSGLAHLLAVSGQNVMLLALLVLAAGALVGAGLRSRLVAAIALIAVYVPLAGAGPSIQRAGVMGAAGLVAALAGRPASRWYALGLAAAVTLAINPRAAGEPGWQLSFAAVVGLLALAPGLRDWLVRAGSPRPVAEAAAVTLAATLATAPLLALHFEQVSLVSLPANLAAAAAVAPVMWLGMLAAAVGQVTPVLAAPLNVVNSGLVAYVERVAEVAAAVPLASVPVRLPGALAAAVAYGALGAAALAVRAVWRRHGAPAAPGPGIARGRLAAAVAAVTVVAIALASTVAERGGAAPRPGELVVSFLDVGQGDATLLQRDGATMLVDTGPADGPILERLSEARVTRLDALVLTHAQDDHEGAALKVMRAYPPRLLVNGGAGWRSPVQQGLAAAIARGVTRRHDPAAGDELAVGAMRMRVHWPPPPTVGFAADGDPNGWALVATVSVGEFDLLLPADAESEVTDGLDLGAAEALKVAHHGSADEGLPELLADVRPAVAAIEVGRRNRYGHPTPSTLQALRAVPRVMRTDRDGTIRLRVRGSQLRVERTGPEL